MNRTGFQSFVNAQPAPGEPGDFASTNPRTSSLGSTAQYQAPDVGTSVGRFAWGNPATGIMGNFFQPESVLGFVHRENQGVITEFLGIDSLTVPEGYPVYSMSRGDFWALFIDGATPGQTVYADARTGVASADAAGQGTESLGFTGAINATTGVLTVSVDGSPATSIEVGMIVTGAGVPPNTYITSLGSGTGGTGTYNLHLGAALSGNISAETMNAYGLIETPFKVGTEVKADASVTASIAVTGLMTVSAVGSGALESGQFLSGTGVPQYAQILRQVSGSTGSTGTYETNVRAVVTSTTIVATQGQVGKITTWQ